VHGEIHNAFFYYRLQVLRIIVHIDDRFKAFLHSNTIRFAKRITLIVTRTLLYTTLLNTILTPEDSTPSPHFQVGKMLSPKYDRKNARPVPNDPYNTMTSINNYNTSTLQSATYRRNDYGRYQPQPHLQQTLPHHKQPNEPQISVSQSNLYQQQKNESTGFLASLGTLGRRKKQQQQQQQIQETAELTVEQVENEGKQAIDSNIQPRILDSGGDYGLGENESRAIIDESSRNSSQFQDLVHTLVNWINDELNDQRIIVKHLEMDLYDGQVLARLVEKLSGTKLDVVDVTQNEDSQKRKLREVLETVNRIFSQQARWAQIKWSVEGIHSRNTVQIIHLLVTMIRHFRPPIKLPQNVTVLVNVHMKQSGGQIVTRQVDEQLTEQYDEFGMKVEPRDAFDTLFDHAPDKLAMVKRSLCGFVNKHLNKINLECFSMHTSGELDPNQFSDGLLLVFLMASLEGYFVPLGCIFTQPTDPGADLAHNGVQTALQYENYVNTSPIHKLHNVNVAFQLMEDADVNVKNRVRAEDIVNADLKSTLRVLYEIFSKYKHM
jgi:parvin